jgi:hypothetical protein
MLTNTYAPTRYDLPRLRRRCCLQQGCLQQLSEAPACRCRRARVTHAEAHAPRISNLKRRTSRATGVIDRGGSAESRTLNMPCLAPADISIRQHTAEYVSIRQHTAAYVSIRQHTSTYVSIRQHTAAYVSIRQQMSAYSHHSPHTSLQLPPPSPSFVRLPQVDMRRLHTSAHVSIRQHTSAYVSIRQHMSAYVSTLPLSIACPKPTCAACTNSSRNRA